MEEKDLSEMTVAELREEAKKYPEIKGVSTKKKEELLEMIAHARGESLVKKEKVPTKKDKKKKGGEKTIGEVKKEIKVLKSEKEKAIANKDKKAREQLRIKLKKLKRLTKKMSPAKT